MLLKTKKKIAKWALGFSLAGGAVTGVVHEISKIEARNAKIDAENQAALTVLVNADADKLRTLGYTVNRQLSAGSVCEQGAVTDGSGYNGSGTAISYEVGRDHRIGKICVNDSNGRFVTSAFKRMVTPGAGTDQTVQELMETDKAELEAHSFHPTAVSHQLGGSCNEDGTTDNTGFQGAKTSLSYAARDNFGQTGHVCADHTEEGVANHLQFSESLRNGHVTHP